MKKTVCCVLLTCFICMLVYAAAENNTTVYVSNGGTGDGSSASSAMGSLTDAYEKVTNGGEIVIVGEMKVPQNKGDTTRTAFTEPGHNGKITVRGLDSSSVLRFDGVYEYHLGGETEFRDLVITSGNYIGGIMFTARGYHLTMGDGLTMKSTATVEGEIGTKVYLIGGCIPGATRTGYLQRNNHLTVRSGSYWGIVGFNRSINQTSTGKALLEVGGAVHTRFLIAGSSGTSSFLSPSGCEVRIIGDLSISKQISLGNQNSAVSSFDSNLIIENGRINFTGDYIDYNARVKLTSLDIYVNQDSLSAVDTYTRMFAGYGDREGILFDYCKNELGGHSYESDVCKVCGSTKQEDDCTEHDYDTQKNGTILTKTCKKCNYTVKLSEKTQTETGVYTYVAGKLRVQILSDGIVRIEQSNDGSFTDKNTLTVNDRSRFLGDEVAFDEDEQTVLLVTRNYTVSIPKNNATASSVKIYDRDGEEIFDYFGTQKNGFYSSLPAPANTPDVFALIDNGIIPAEGGLTYTGSNNPTSDWTRTDNTDLYVLVPLGDSVRLRALFTELTGPTMMSDIKTLGSWYSRWTNYTAEQKLEMIEQYRKKGIPLDMIVVDTEWKNTSVGGNGGDGTGYITNTQLYPNMRGFLSAANEAGVLVLFNDHTHQTSQYITSPTELKWQSEGLKSILKLGLDGWWYDRNWTYSMKSPYSDVLFSTIGQVHYYDTINKYASDTRGEDYARRVLMLSNVDWIKHGHITGEPSVIGHRYGIQWTGDIQGDPLQLKREIENMVISGINGGSPYVSSDLGGYFHNDTVTKNNFIRWMQYGAFSPIVRVHSRMNLKNEHYPWSYDRIAEDIIDEYLEMRYHLMPYYYTLARENYESGMPLMRRLDFYYPQYEESQDNTQYLIGKDILAAPFWSTRGEGQYAVPSSWLKTESGERGLTARYYNISKTTTSNNFFTSSPVITDTVENIDFYWYTGSPASAVNTDYFTACFTGSITPEYDCYIGTLADDGANVYIDGKLWSNGYESTELKPFVNTSKILKAGQTYELKVEYYEKVGKAILYFVCEPVVNVNESQRSVFIPDGTWINVFTGEEVSGPCTLTVTGSIREMPLYVRKGAAIPTSKVISPMTGADWSEISVNVYGLSDTSFVLYEDDGESEGYVDGQYRKTDVCVKTLSEDTWQIDIGGAQGDYSTDYSERAIKLRVHSDTPITEASVNGSTVTVTRIEADGNALPFSNEGASRISDVYEIVADVSVNDGATILLTYTTLDKVVSDTSGDGTLTVVLIAAGVVISIAVIGAVVFLAVKKKAKKTEE